MTNQTLINQITSVVKANGAQGITGTNLQGVLVEMAKTNDIDNSLGLSPITAWGKNTSDNKYYFGWAQGEQSWGVEEVSLGEIFLVRNSGNYVLDPQNSTTVSLGEGDFIRCTQAGSVNAGGYTTYPIFERVQLDAISEILRLREGVDENSAKITELEQKVGGKSGEVSAVGVKEVDVMLNVFKGQKLEVELSQHTSYIIIYGNKNGTYERLYVIPQNETNASVLFKSDYDYFRFANNVAEDVVYNYRIVGLPETNESRVSELESKTESLESKTESNESRVSELESEIVNLQNINDLQDQFMEEGLDKKLDKKIGRNIINPNAISIDKYVNSQGTLSDATTTGIYAASDYIAVSEDVICGDVNQSSASFPCYVVYNQNKEFVRVVMQSQLYNWEDGDSYVKINLREDYKDNPTFFACYGNVLQPYEPYTENYDVYLSNKRIDELNTRVEYLEQSEEGLDYLNGCIRSVICIGDSVTEGLVFDYPRVSEPPKYSALVSYPKFLSQLTGWKVVNAGQSGNSSSDWYERHIESHDYQDFDLVIIELGYNNTWSSNTLDTDAPLANEWISGESYSIGDRVTHGKVRYRCVSPNSDIVWTSENWILSCDDYADTDFGNYCKIIETIIDKNPFALMTLVISSQFNNLAASFVSSIAERYTLPIIDLRDTNGINLNDIKYHGYRDLDAMNSGTIDYTHFNCLGYCAKAKKIYDEIMSQFVNNISLFNEYITGRLMKNRSQQYGRTYEGYINEDVN